MDFGVYIIGLVAGEGEHKGHRAPYEGIKQTASNGSQTGGRLHKEEGKPFKREVHIKREQQDKIVRNDKNKPIHIATIAPRCLGW